MAGYRSRYNKIRPVAAADLHIPLFTALPDRKLAAGMQLMPVAEFQQAVDHLALLRDPYQRDPGPLPGRVYSRGPYKCRLPG